MHFFWQRRKHFGLMISLMVVLALVSLCVPQERPVPGASNTIISHLVGKELFDFVEWMGDAWLEKAGQLSVPVQDFLATEQRSQFVLNFVRSLEDWWNLEWQVRQSYADASTTDPETQTQALRLKRDALRTEIERQRPTAEAIIQQQIASVLVAEGFGVGGEIFPPVAARITPLPYVLIISPRDEINRVSAEALQTGLSVDEADRIEAQVLHTTKQSALVVPIGGLAAYPTMIVETGDSLWLMQTIAHEWVHNWLYLRPLGYSYLAEEPVIRTINETVASLAGDELGLKVMRRYYLDTLKQEHPDWVEPKPLEAPDLDPIAPSPPKRESSEFSYNQALYETRLKVEELLIEARQLKVEGKLVEAEAKIVAAESYMEERRQFINSHGYGIRKLNQAFFAFYGAYADQPGGAAGSDPTGPAVVALRAYSPGLRQFLDRVSSILTQEELLKAVADFKAQR
ncbi:hypothetical protein TFLX_01073 [Thermoflexales bacterium]|nr:hypothetical protein TFLX_01073 [Thermoflexales bacterium]